MGREQRDLKLPVGLAIERQDVGTIVGAQGVEGWLVALEVKSTEVPGEGRVDTVLLLDALDRLAFLLPLILCHRGTSGVLFPGLFKISRRDALLPAADRKVPGEALIDTEEERVPRRSAHRQQRLLFRLTRFRDERVRLLLTRAGARSDRSRLMFRARHIDIRPQVGQPPEPRCRHDPTNQEQPPRDFHRRAGVRHALTLFVFRPGVTLSNP